MEKKVILLFMFLLMFSFGMAKQPVQVSTGADALQVFYPDFDYLPQDTAFKLHTHLSNISDGMPLRNTEATCNLHLYYPNGSHSTESVMGLDGNTWDYELDIARGNFSTLGEHGFYIWCNSTTQGGEAKGTFQVTPTGKELTSGGAIIMVGLLGILILFLGVVMFGYFKMPDHVRDDDGFVLSVSKLTYLKPVMLGVGWILLTGIMFIASNIAVGYLSTGLLGAFLFAIWRIMLLSNIIIIPLMVIKMIQDIALSKEMMGLIERGVEFK